MAAFDVQTAGFDELKKKIADAKTSIASFKPAYKKTAVFLDRWVQQNFKSQGGKVGGWVPFSAETDRFIKDPGAKLLQDTGRLRLSFIPFASEDNAGIGSELSYAAPHNNGGAGDRPPERRIIPKPAEVEDDITKIFDSEIDKGLRDANLK